MISEVCHYLNTTEKEFRPSGRISVNILKNKQHELFKVNVLLRKRFSEAEVEMDRKSWERRYSDIAQYETQSTT